MSLLDKAMAAPSARKRQTTPRWPPEERFDLCEAYLEGRIALSQLSAAIGKSNNPNVIQWVGNSLIAAYRAGLIARVKKEGA